MLDRRWAPVLGALVVLLILGGGVFVVSRLGGEADNAVETAVPTSEPDRAEVPDEFPTEEGLSDGTIDMQIDPDTQPTVDTTEQIPYVWQPRVIGGGGWVKGIEIHPSGEPVIARTDVGGAYRYDRASGVWDQLIMEDRVEGLRGLDYRVDSIGLAASDPERIYLLVGEAGPDAAFGRMLVSADGGVSFTSSDQTLVTHGNGASRNGGERVSVSPTDPDDVWMGASDGLMRSRDAGLTFEPVTSAPRGTADIESQRGIEWVLAETDVVYIGVAGSGVHRSLDDGRTWEQLWAATERPFDAEVDDNGVLWAVNSEERLVRRFEPATGQTRVITDLEGQDLRGLAVRPTGDDIVVAVSNGYWVSSDGGQGWDFHDVSFRCPQFPWQNEFDFSLFTASSPEFDPLAPETLWQPEGFGIWTADDIRAAGTIDLRCRVTGVEEIVVNDLVAPATDVVVAASWDRALFHLPSGGGPAAKLGPTDRFNSAWSLATTPADPNMVVAVVADHRFCCEEDGNAYMSGVSRDGGRTWRRFASYDNGTHPQELRFGNIAVSATDPDNLAWLPTFNAPLHYSTDGGASWIEVIVPGTEEMLSEDGANNGGSHFRNDLRRTVLVADSVAGGTFYLLHQDLGFHRSTDGGASWELVSADGVPTGWTAGWFNAELVAVPGEEGHLLYTPGELLEAVFPMYESLDAGATWAGVAGTSAVHAIGTGAPLADGGPPTVFIAGSINARPGFWRSGDSLESWEFIGSTAGGIGAATFALAGDPGIPGRVYIGFDGVSVMQGDPN